MELKTKKQWKTNETKTWTIKNTQNQNKNDEKPMKQYIKNEKPTNPKKNQWKTHETKIQTMKNEWNQSIIKDRNHNAMMKNPWYEKREKRKSQETKITAMR